MGQTASLEDANIDETPSSDLLGGYQPAALPRTVYAAELSHFVTEGREMSDAESLLVLQRAEAVCGEMEDACHHASDPRAAAGL